MKAYSYSNHVSVDSPNSDIYGNFYPPVSAQPGQVWYDGGQQTLVVYTGSSWVPYDPSLNVGMPMATERALDELIKIVNTSNQLAASIDKYPLVADAMKQLEVALKLCQNLEDESK